MSHLSDRDRDFRRILNALDEFRGQSFENAALVHGDSLNVLSKLPDSCASLIVTDPPYHSTKKKNITGDTSFSEDDHFVEWISAYIEEWKRVLRPNGTVYMFCSSKMSAKLELAFEERFNVLAQVVWTKPNAPGFDGWKQKMKKEALRQWYPHSERIIVAEPAVEGNLHRSYFADLLRTLRQKAGLSGHQLTEMTGAYGAINHGGAVSNWETGRNIPSREQYSKLCVALISTGNVSEMPPYEDVIRPFNVTKDSEFSDVWNFESVRPYKGKHPAEKPLDMLEHIISTSSYPGDIVLDCFSGSGSTLVAAVKLQRRAVGIEIEDKHFENSVERLRVISDEEFALTEVQALREVDAQNTKQLSML